ncbi:MAG: 6-bladed beta-propeller [Gemmatimonadota bacterium]
MLINVLICASGQVSAQQIVDIPSTPLCRDCRLEFRRLLGLGAADGEGALAGEPTSVVQDTRGNYYITQFQDRTSVVVFSRTGQFVQRIGRTGRGPGEYTRIAFVTVGAGDSLYVFDQANARITVLSPTYAVARTTALAGQYFGAVHLPDGRLVANAHIPAPDRIGQPLQTLGKDGVVQAVYGAQKPEYKPNITYSVMRTIGSAGENRVWSGYKTRYVIEEWNADSKQLRVVSRSVPWFKAYDRRRPITQVQPAEPWLVALHQDVSGLLWSAVTVPGEDWGKRWVDLGSDEKKGFPGDQRMFDTMVEVLDLDRRQVLVSQRMPQYVLGFLNDSTSFGYKVDAGEVPNVEIWRTRLIRGNARR